MDDRTLYRVFLHPWYSPAQYRLAAKSVGGEDWGGGGGIPRIGEMDDEIGQVYGPV
jgi:hypothetical protein